MQRSFTHIVLITLLFLFASCHTGYEKTTVDPRNIFVEGNYYLTDSQLVKIYMPYKRRLENDMSRVISTAEEKMVKGRPESRLTNFLGDLLLEEGRKAMRKAGKAEGPDISYFNYGGIRTFLPEGEITVGKIFELMPFENELVLLRLNGEQVRRFLDILAAKGGDSVGGVRFQISEGRATGIEIAGKPLQEEADYWIVTNDYVAEGGAGMEVLTEADAFFSTGTKIRDVIISHLEAKQEAGIKLKGRHDGRIAYE